MELCWGKVIDVFYSLLTKLLRIVLKINGQQKFILSGIYEVVLGKNKVLIIMNY